LTQETKNALELYARYKRAKGAVNKAEEDTRLLKDGLGDDLRTQLIGEEVKKWVTLGEDLRVYCKGKTSIRQDLEAEVRRIDAKIKKECGKFDSEHKAELDRLQETVRKEEKKAGPISIVEDVLGLLKWLLAIGWLVFYFVVVSKDPSDPTFGFLRQLFYSEIMLLFLLVPPALIFVLFWFINDVVIDHFTTPGVVAERRAKENIEAIQKSRAALIASIEKEKEDYLEIINLV